MPYMRNISTGAFVGPLPSDGAEYRYLQQQRDGNNHPTWEDTGVEDAEAAGALIDGKAAETVQVLADAVAAGVDAAVIVGRAPFTGTIAKVSYYPAAAVTGANTDSRTVSLVNAVAGVGATVVATEPLVSGSNLATEAENDLPLSVVAHATEVNTGDEVEWKSTHVGAGIADPGGLVVVTFTRE